MRLGLPILATGSLAMAAASLYYATAAVRSQWLGRTYWRGRNRPIFKIGLKIVTQRGGGFIAVTRIPRHRAITYGSQFTWNR